MLPNWNRDDQKDIIWSEKISEKSADFDLEDFRNNRIKKQSAGNELKIAFGNRSR